MPSRREWLKAASVLAGAAGLPGLAGRSAAQASPTDLPWRNWSGGQLCQPAARFAPSSEQMLADFLESSEGSLRPVGAGHSFSPVVPTDGTLLVLDRLNGLLDYDAPSQQATFAAGTRMADMGPMLERIDQGFMNMSDIDRQTFAGAVSTSTHGTGIGLGSYSSYVTELRLVTPAGEILDVNAENHPELFEAARVSLGALGVITRIRIQNRPAYGLRRRTWYQRTDELLEDIVALTGEHRHFEMFPLVHSDYSVALTSDPIDDFKGNTIAIIVDADDEATLRLVAKVPVLFRSMVINGIAAATGPVEDQGPSYSMLASIRSGRFNEMEYQVPADAGPDCLREILATIVKQRIDIAYPLEYRYVKGDDAWLSMFHGRDSASISVHQFWDLDYRPYFEQIEPIFWKYEGRPHWGKLHTLTARELAGRYPHWRDFGAVREAIDPAGRMLNDHLRGLFGVS